MDEVRFNEEQAALANEIKQIDRQLDELDEHTRKSIQWGLLGSGTGTGALAREQTQQHDDHERAALTKHRQVLAEQLRASIEQSQTLGGETEPGFRRAAAREGSCPPGCCG